MSLSGLIFATSVFIAIGLGRKVGHRPFRFGLSFDQEHNIGKMCFAAGF